MERLRRIEDEEFKKKRRGGGGEGKERRRKKERKTERGREYGKGGVRAKSNLHRPSHRWSLAPDKGQFSLIFVSFEYLH